MIYPAMDPGWIQETFKSQWDKTFYQASFGCEENTEILFLQELIERPHRLFVLASLSDAKISEV